MNYVNDFILLLRKKGGTEFKSNSALWPMHMKRSYFGNYFQSNITIQKMYEKIRVEILFVIR